MTRIAIFALIASAIALSACGRKGPLEAPTGAVNPPPQTGQPQSAPVEDKPFVLDGLIQ